MSQKQKLDGDPKNDLEALRQIFGREFKRVDNTHGRFAGLPYVEGALRQIADNIKAECLAMEIYHAMKRLDRLLAQELVYFRDYRAHLILTPAGCEALGIE